MKVIVNSPSREIKRANICIIGSGIAGGTLAKRLYDMGVGFTLIEAGGLKKGQANVTYESVGREFGIRSTRSIQLGGTSNLWHGVLAPLDEIDFKKRNWIPNSGWPIGLSDLQNAYIEAGKILGVQQPECFNKINLPSQLKAQLESLPYNKEYLANKLFQQPIPVVNFKSVIRKICDNSDKFHCYLNMTALELIYHDDKIKFLKIGCPDGSVTTIEAQQFIVCAGALETPRLLLNSGIKNDNIGKYLMDHPMGNLCQMEFLQPETYPIYSDTKLSSSVKIKSGFEITRQKQQVHKLPNHNFYLRPSFVKGINNESEKIKLSLLALKDGKLGFKDIWNVLTSPNVIRQILVYKYSLKVKFKYADLFFVTEQLPNPNSTVSLSEKRDLWGYPISKVNWQLMKEDTDGLYKWFELLLTELFPKEYYCFTHKLSDFNWEKIFTSACHHLGTTRMGRTPDDGVVDSNLKVFGFSNLYVCDGSVFATAGNVNSSYTIAALAVRLANYLREVI
ncbi:GMC oxidoreductase [Facilibium subflavum]|uniref:GMC oxidoreductase n=1 Tax=Facilibium subflavum TaxID=2219058 RepID=UPI000E64BA65|nr:GMC oxidoreductase [Facilibium subflavum]